MMILIMNIKDNCIFWLQLRIIYSLFPIAAWTAVQKPTIWTNLVTAASDARLGVQQMGGCGVCLLCSIFSWRKELQLHSFILEIVRCTRP